MDDIQFTEADFHYRFNELTKADCETKLFESEWLVSAARLHLVNNRGRGQVDIFDHNGEVYISRPYLRGGLIAKLLSDKYIWTGLEKSRPWQEFSILAAMRAMGLKCPEPYACRVRHDGVFSRGSIITLYIDHSKTLAETLCEREVTDSEWNAIGQCIRQFHDAGVFHSDLNANNILMSRSAEVFLIDFDKAKFRKNHHSRQGKAWKYASLKRLQRSIMKCWMDADTFHFSPASWEHLKSGYLSHLKNPQTRTQSRTQTRAPE